MINIMQNLISFDYAIKYLLRNRANYGILEDFISAVIETGGHPPVKIKMPLERESNKESSDLKGSIADMAVEDTQGKTYLVEVDRSAAVHFLHKACFNTSRLIVDTIPSAGSYLDIKKIIHISVLYTPPKEFDSYLYHINTVVNSIKGATKEQIEIVYKSHNLCSYAEILPQYFVIAVPLFNDEVATKLDEWVFFIKNQALRQGCHNPMLQEAYKRFSIINMSPEERTEYIKYCASNEKIKDYIITSRQEGLEEGLEQGKIEGKIEVARNLLKEGMDIETIAMVTDLSMQEIQKLKD